MNGDYVWIHVCVSTAFISISYLEETTFKWMNKCASWEWVKEYYCWILHSLEEERGDWKLQQKTAVQIHTTCFVSLMMKSVTVVAFYVFARCHFMPSIKNRTKMNVRLETTWEILCTRCHCSFHFSLGSSAYIVFNCYLFVVHLIVYDVSLHTYRLPACMHVQAHVCCCCCWCYIILLYRYNANILYPHSFVCNLS